MARSKAKAKTVGKKSRRSKSKSRTISVDMEGVEVSSKVSDGDYELELSEIVEKESEEGNPYLLFIFTTDRGSKLYHICSLQPQALFNLRMTIEALGVEVPDSSMDIDLDSLEGLTCAGSVVNEDYQGKTRPKIVELFDVRELDPEDAPEDEPEDEPEEKKASKKSNKKKSNKKAVIEEGSAVIFEDEEGEDIAGVILSIEDDIAEVQDEEKEIWDVEISDLTLA